MDSIVVAVLMAIIFTIFIVVKFSLELRANRQREERGEAPKKHHDATDGPAPVNVIDWTKQ